MRTRGVDLVPRFGIAHFMQLGLHLIFGGGFDEVDFSLLNDVLTKHHKSLGIWCPKDSTLKTPLTEILCLKFLKFTPIQLLDRNLIVLNTYLPLSVRGFVSTFRSPLICPPLSSRFWLWRSISFLCAVLCIAV